MFSFSTSSVWLLLLGVWTVAYAVSDIKTLNKSWIKNDMKPSEWISLENLNALPAVNDITWDMVQKLPTYKGAKMVHKLYHLAKIGEKIQPTFTPSPSEIPCFLINTKNERVNFKLDKLVMTVNEQIDFGKHDVTIIISSLPEELEPVRLAHEELLDAYIKRYLGGVERLNSVNKKILGNVIVIDLGAVIRNVKDMFTLNVQKLGITLGNLLVQLTEKTDVSHEVIHVIGENMAAHVAGVAGRTYNRLTGLRLRRITGLDPLKLLPRYNSTLTGLARGDADFVDVIHSSTYAMGMKQRCGDADFYPNGLEVDASLASNIVEASMLATRFYAESVLPGNEYNFPAVTANSLKEIQTYDSGIVSRTYMGISTHYDVKGDFILEVNTKSPFGRSIMPLVKKSNRILNKMMSFEYMS